MSHTQSGNPLAQVSYQGGNAVLKAGDGGPWGKGADLILSGGDAGPGGDGGSLLVEAGKGWGDDGLEALAARDSWRVNDLPPGVTIDMLRLLDDQGFIEAYPWHLDYSESSGPDGPPPRPQRLNNWSLGWVSPIKDKQLVGTWDQIAAKAAEEPLTALEVRLTDRAHAERTRRRMPTVETKAIPAKSGPILLGELRDRALHLRTEDRDVFDQQVVAAEGWYLKKCSEAQKALDANGQAERDAVRASLRRGVLETPRCGRASTLRPYWLNGRFPRQLIDQIKALPACSPGTWPTDIQRRMARACIDVITWGERTHTPGPHRDEWQVRWEACCPLDKRPKLTAFPVKLRPLYKKFAERHAAGEFVQWRVMVVYAQPNRKPPLPNPRRLTWEQIRELSDDDRRSLAWSVIGGLINAQTIAPITAPRPKWKDIPASDGDAALAHLIEETRLDRLAPVIPRNADQMQPGLDASALDPSHAADLMRIVEDDFRSMIGPGVTSKDDPYRTASFFGKPLGSLLRHASAAGRKRKRVRSIDRKGVKMYHIDDVRMWWPRQLARAEQVEAVAGA